MCRVFNVLLCPSEAKQSGISCWCLSTFLSFAAVCLVVGVVTYPAGWDASDVRRTCGTSAGRYELGECGLRWAYLLAVIGCLDAVILAALAFILATRHVRLQAEPGYTANGSLYKGEWQDW
jgi:hypothetical protein